MCGLSGIYRWERAISSQDIESVQKMNSVLAHRGPDGSGIYTSEHLVLGHRRLSIIDLEHGEQPMASKCGRYVLAFNGEIFNYIELRKTLEQLGREFAESSDTEVLLQALLEWGEDALQYLNGDFAFAFWDSAEQTLMLARDRLGVKPLHVMETDQGVVFGSEIKALASVLPSSCEIDIYGYFETLAYGQPLPPRTLFNGISILEPGTYIKYCQGHKAEKTYWDIKYNPVEATDSEAQARVRELLIDATRLRLRSDVPVCALLSGGIDSSALCGVIKELTGKPFDTFSVDYEWDSAEEENLSTHLHGSDMAFAQQVADMVGSDHHSILLDADLYHDSLSLPANARDLPVCLGSETGMYHLFREIKKTATVALSGDGADEVFLGYYMLIEESLKKGTVDPYFANSSAQIFQLLDPEIIEKYKPTEYIEQRFNEILAKAPEGEDEQTTLLNQIHYLQIKVILPYLLDRADRLSSAHSVELRVPYCDHRVVEYFFNLPYDKRVVPGVEKYTLRKAFENYVPSSVFERKKSVFPYPGKPEKLDELYENALGLIKDDKTPVSKASLLNPQAVEFIVMMAKAGSFDHFRAHAICSHVLTLNLLMEKDLLKGTKE